MSLEKRMQTIRDRQEYRRKSMERLELVQSGDMTKMFGLLAQTLADRRRETELDVIRCERFHTDNAEMLERAKTQLADYDRRLEIASGILKMLVTLQGEESLMDLLKIWCKNLPLWREEVA